VHYSHWEEDRAGNQKAPACRLEADNKMRDPRRQQPNNNSKPDNDFHVLLLFDFPDAPVAKRIEEICFP
jgi:hypothetical protein